MLELTGRTGESPWFDFLNDLRRTAPVVQKQAVMLSDGTLVPDLAQWAAEDPTGQTLADQILQWRQWSYYHLRYKDIP